MSTKAAALRTCIAVLTAQLAIEEGKPANTYLGQILPQFDTDEAERQRLEQIANSEKPHAYVAPGIGVLRDQAGTNEGAPRSFVTHRAIIDAAERGDPVIEGGERIFTNGQGGWPGPDGKVFRMDDYKEKGPEAMHKATEWLWTESPHGTAWKTSPAVQAQLPRNSDGSLAAPQLHPITR